MLFIMRTIEQTNCNRTFHSVVRNIVLLKLFEVKKRPKRPKKSPTQVYLLGQPSLKFGLLHMKFQAPIDITVGVHTFLLVQMHQA